MLRVEIGFSHSAMGKHLGDSRAGGYKVSWQDLLEQKPREGLGALPHSQPGGSAPPYCRSPASEATGPLVLTKPRGRSRRQGCRAISLPSKASVVHTVCFCLTHFQHCALSHMAAMETKRTLAFVKLELCLLGFGNG